MHVLLFVSTSECHSAVEIDTAPLRAGQRTFLRETFDLSQPAPLTRMDTAVSESQLPLPHTPRSDANELQGGEPYSWPFLHVRLA